MSVFADHMVEQIESSMEEMFGMIEQTMQDSPITLAEAEQAKEIGLAAFRMYTQASTDDSPLPHWIVDRDGLVLALTVARFAAYAYLTTQAATERDSLEGLLNDTRALFLAEGEEE